MRERESSERNSKYIRRERKSEKRKEREWRLPVFGGVEARVFKFIDKGKAYMVRIIIISRYYFISSICFHICD